MTLPSIESERILTGPTDFYTFDDGSTLTWPTDRWMFSEDDDGNLYLESNLTSVMFSKYFNSVYQENALVPGDNRGLMEALFHANDADIVFDVSHYRDLQVGQFAAGHYEFVDGSDDLAYKHVFVLLQFGNDSTALFSIIPLDGFEIAEMDAVMKLIAGFTDVT